MARPSKKTIELRKQITDLEVYKRDNEVYTNLESSFLQNNKYGIAYYFTLECFFRNPNKGNGNIVADIIEDGRKNILRQQALYISLNSININIAEYFIQLKMSTFDEFLYKNVNKEYFVEHELEINVLKNALSEERLNYFYEELLSFNLDEIMEADRLEFPLTDKEKEDIINSLNEAGWKSDKTIVHYSTLPHEIESILNDNRNKRIYAELDLTKPLDEIIDYVTMLKNDFDSNPDDFKNAHELLGEEHEVFSCNLNRCSIYKDTKSPKPISGRLADVLFIYDCKKVNELLGADILTNDYITGEINRYWQKVKNISPDGFHSLEEYYAIAKEYIDEQRYKDYLTGIKHTL